MANEILFQRGAWSVSREVITTPRIDWKASEVVGVEVSRMPYWSALGVGAGGLLMIWGLFPVLYRHEMLIGVAVIGGIVMLGTSIGIMRVSMEAMRGAETGQVVGPMSTLVEMRRAIRRVLAEKGGA